MEEDNFIDPVANPQEDRITAILQKRAQPIQFSQDQYNNAGQAAIHYALAGQNRGVNDILDSIRNPILAQQDRELESARGLYDLFEEKRAGGDRQAQAVADAMGKITSNPDDQGKLLEWLHALPEKVDPNNPNKLLMLLARGKRELGIQTDFERGEAEKDLERRVKEAQIRNYDALATKRASGGGAGGNGVTGFTYDKIIGALTDAGVQITPDIDLQAISLARGGIKMGSTINVNGQDIALENIMGMEDVLRSQKEAEAEGTAIGKVTGEQMADLANLEAALPGYEEIAGQLYNLAAAATYTGAGRGRDFMLRQFGVDVGDAGEARATLETTIDNEVFPILKQTLGAQFTQSEGQWLKTMFLDPNMSPDEKQAQLESWLTSKYRQVEYLRRRVDAPTPEGYERKTAKSLSINFEDLPD